MQLSISEAARRAGVRRQVLYRKIETGLLSKVIQEDGKPVIDLSELARVFPQALEYVEQPKQTGAGVNGNFATAAAQQAIDVLKERVAAAEADKTQLRRDLERERAERDRLMSLLEAAQRKLTGPDTVTTPNPRQPAPPQHRGFWARLTGQPA